MSPKLRLIACLFALSYCCSIPSILHAQPLPLAWVASTGGTNVDQGKALVVDGQGNTYTAGFHQATADLDPGAATLIAPGPAIFVQKFDTAGQLLWAVNYLSTGFFYPHDLALDLNGDLVMSGNYAGTIDFDPGAGVSNLTAQGSTDLFLLKLSPAGNFIWVQNAISGVGNNELPKGLVIDHQNKIVIVGHSDAIADADPSGSAAMICSGASSDAFVAKYDANGNYLWAYGFGSTGPDFGLGVTVDVHNVVTMVGKYAATVDFDPTMGVSNLTAMGSFDGYILRLSPTGSFIWVHPLASAAGNGNNCSPTSIVTDAAGDILMGGAIFGIVDLDPGPNTALTTTNGLNDMFVAKLDSGGNYLWSFHLGSSYQDDLVSLSTDINNNIYFSGQFEGAMDFDPGTGVFNASNLGLKDGAVCKFGPTGSFQWVAILASANNDFISQIDISTQNAVFATGTYYVTVDFDPSSGVHNLTSAGAADAFLYKLGVCTQPVDASISDSSCGPYSLNGSTYDSSGTYMQYLTTNMGCDSILTLHLTVQPLIATLATSGNALTASPNGSSYQWLDCDNGFSPILGAMNQTFSPSMSGNYAVVVTQGACIDTSTCMQIFLVRLLPTQVPHISLFPNPASRTVYLESDIALGDICVTNTLGQTIWKASNLATKAILLNVNEWARGIYFFKVNEIVRRFVLE